MLSSNNEKKSTTGWQRCLDFLKNSQQVYLRKKILVREEARHHITKHVISISLIRMKEEKSVRNNEVDGENIVEPNKSNLTETLEEVDGNDEVENKTNNEPVRSAKEKLTRIKGEELVEVPSSCPVGYYLKHKINEKLINGLVNNQRFNDSLLATRVGIAKDVLVEVAGYVYPVDFMILDIKEDEKRPFILGTQFLTTTKAVIKFDKGIITLRYGKNKISFHKIPKPLCRIKKGTKNNIEPIASSMAVNRLILEWEEKIGLHKGKEMEFDQ
ncbi:zinc finger, CCHC-type containing protein [Tanacetum coccineum]